MHEVRDRSRDVQESVRRSRKATRCGTRSRAPSGHVYTWQDNRPTCACRRTSRASACSRARSTDVKGARVLGIFGDSITTDHISPAGGISPTSPAGKYLQENGVAVADFNTYGARRGNHEVMMRGTFANVRIKNLMLPGTEGGITIHQPSGEQMPIYDAAMKYKADRRAVGGVRRRRIRPGLLARLGGERPAAARREGGDRAQLRAHPPRQPRLHGRAAAAVQGRRHRAVAAASTAPRRSTSLGIGQASRRCRT